MTDAIGNDYKDMSNVPRVQFECPRCKETSTVYVNKEGTFKCGCGAQHIVKDTKKWNQK